MENFSSQKSSSSLTRQLFIVAPRENDDPVLFQRNFICYWGQLSDDGDGDDDGEKDVFQVTVPHALDPRPVEERYCEDGRPQHDGTILHYHWGSGSCRKQQKHQ